MSGLDISKRYYKSTNNLASSSPQKSKTVKNSPRTLLDTCVDRIVKCSELSGAAVTTLPPVVAHYVLYRAVQRLKDGEVRSYLIIHKMISKWTREELSFNFRSNPLVQKYPSVSGYKKHWGCVEPHEYYGIRGVSKSHHNSCIRDIAVGLFNHVYHRDCADSEGRVDLKHIDLSDFEQLSTHTKYSWEVLATEPLYQLIRGEFPGRDAYECFSPENIMFHGKQKPTLRQYSGRPPILIHINIKFVSVTDLEEFVKSSCNHTRYKLQLKSLDVSAIKETRPSLENLDMSEVNTFILSGDQVIPDSLLSQPSCLWILQEKAASTATLQQALTSPNLSTLLLSVSHDTCLSVLEAVSKTSIGLRALSVFGCGPSIAYALMGKCLRNLSSTLEYLHLQSWLPTCMPLNPLYSLTNLRVLSITAFLTGIHDSPSHTFVQLFQGLSHLEKLEYLELHQPLHLAAGDLVAIQSTLVSSLPNLNHCHMNFSFLALTRADLDVPSNAPVAQLIRSFFMTMARGGSLLYRTEEKFTIGEKSTALLLMKRWLSQLRPSVCFKVGVEMNYTSHLAHTRQFSL